MLIFTKSLLRSAAISAMLQRCVTRQHHMYVALKIEKKNQKILLYVSINKVICTKYIVESTWYLCMSRCGRKRESERSKTSIKDFRGDCGEAAGGGEGLGETRSGTEKQCSHDLQSGHPAW